MPLHRVHLQDCPPQPWRNGGGLTRELLVWPRDAAAGAWQLRLSVADIERDGPFSPFPGLRRWFAVLSGAGVSLALPQGAVTLRPHDPPLAFDGADAPACALLGGPTRDLNLMAQDHQGVAQMQAALPGSRLEAAPGWRALFAAEAACLTTPHGVEELPAGTLAWAAGHGPDPAAHPPGSGLDDAAGSWTLRTGAHAFWLTWSPR